MPTDDLTEELLDANALAIDLAAAPITGGLPVASSLLTGARLVSGMMARHGAAKLQEDYELLVLELAKETDSSPPDAAERLERLLAGAGPVLEEKLYNAWRSRALMRSSKAWKYMARLTAKDIRDARPVDLFFKRVSFVLERCEDEDIGLLETACAGTRATLIAADAATKGPDRAPGEKPANPCVAVQ